MNSIITIGNETLILPAPPLPGQKDTSSLHEIFASSAYKEESPFRKLSNIFSYLHPKVLFSPLLSLVAKIIKVVSNLLFSFRSLFFGRQKESLRRFYVGEDNPISPKNFKIKEDEIQVPNTFYRDSNRQDWFIGHEKIPKGIDCDTASFSIVSKLREKGLNDQQIYNLLSVCHQGIFADGAKHSGGVTQIINGLTPCFSVDVEGDHVIIKASLPYVFQNLFGSTRFIKQIQELEYKSVIHKNDLIEVPSSWEKALPSLKCVTSRKIAKNPYERFKTHHLKEKFNQFDPPQQDSSKSILELFVENYHITHSDCVSPQLLKRYPMLKNERVIFALDQTQPENPVSLSRNRRGATRITVRSAHVIQDGETVIRFLKTEIYTIPTKEGDFQTLKELPDPILFEETYEKVNNSPLI